MNKSKISFDLREFIIFFSYGILVLTLGIFLMTSSVQGQFIGAILGFVGIIVLVFKALHGSGKAPFPAPLTATSKFPDECAVCGG